MPFRSKQSSILPFFIFILFICVIIVAQICADVNTFRQLLSIFCELRLFRRAETPIGGSGETDVKRNDPTEICRIVLKFVVRTTLVPLNGFEPLRYLYHGILSPACLPIPSQRRKRERKSVPPTVSSSVFSFVFLKLSAHNHEEDRNNEANSGRKRRNPTAGHERDRKTL